MLSLLIISESTNATQMIHIINKINLSSVNDNFAFLASVQPSDRRERDYLHNQHQMVYLQENEQPGIKSLCRNNSSNFLFSIKNERQERVVPFNIYHLSIIK